MALGQQVAAALLVMTATTPADGFIRRVSRDGGPFVGLVVPTMHSRWTPSLSPPASAQAKPYPTSTSKVDRPEMSSPLISVLNYNVCLHGGSDLICIIVRAEVSVRNHRRPKRGHGHDRPQHGNIINSLNSFDMDRRERRGLVDM
jgi:hypothetical protein